MDILLAIIAAITTTVILINHRGERYSSEVADAWGTRYGELVQRCDERCARLEAVQAGFEERVKSLSIENDRLRAEVKELRKTIEGQVEIISGMKAELLRRDARIVSLERKNSVLDGQLRLIQEQQCSR